MMFLKVLTLQTSLFFLILIVCSQLEFEPLERLKRPRPTVMGQLSHINTSGHKKISLTSATKANALPVSLTVNTYVRNVSSIFKNTCIPGSIATTYNGVDYCASNTVSANPGDILEYLVVVTNISNENATDVVLNAMLPAQSSYVTSSIVVDTNGDETFNVSIPEDETEADNQFGIITQLGSNIQVFLGTGGNENTNEGGVIYNVNIAPNNKTAVLYRVTVGNTAAGVALTSSATIDYDDASGTAQPQITTSVAVSADHVPGVSWGEAPVGQTTNSGALLPSAYSISLTNTGNGEDFYTITDNTTNACSSGTLSAESFSFFTPVALGATISNAEAQIGSLTISTADDTNIADGVVRRIAIGDIIKIGSQLVTVTAVSENDAGSGNTIIMFDSALTVATPTGTQIGEQKTVFYGASGTAGTVSAGASGCAHAHELTILGSTATGGNTNSSDSVSGWNTNVEGSTLTVSNYENNSFIYPNPVKSSLNITSNNALLSTIKIYGINGNLIKNISLKYPTNDYALDTRKLATGLYFLEVQSATAKQILKFIKI